MGACQSSLSDSSESSSVGSSSLGGASVHSRVVMFAHEDSRGVIHVREQRTTTVTMAGNGGGANGNGVVAAATHPHPPAPAAAPPHWLDDSVAAEFTYKHTPGPGGRTLDATGLRSADEPYERVAHWLPPHLPLGEYATAAAQLTGGISSTVAPATQPHALFAHLSTNSPHLSARGFVSGTGSGASTPRLSQNQALALALKNSALSGGGGVGGDAISARAWERASQHNAAANDVVNLAFSPQATSSTPAERSREPSRTHSPTSQDRAQRLILTVNTTGSGTNAPTGTASYHSRTTNMRHVVSLPNSPNHARSRSCSPAGTPTRRAKYTSLRVSAANALLLSMTSNEAAMVGAAAAAAAAHTPKTAASRLHRAAAEALQEAELMQAALSGATNATAMTTTTTTTTTTMTRAGRTTPSAARHRSLRIDVDGLPTGGSVDSPVPTPTAPPTHLSLAAFKKAYENAYAKAQARSAKNAAAAALAAQQQRPTLPTKAKTSGRYSHARSESSGGGGGGGVGHGGQLASPTVVAPVRASSAGEDDVAFLDPGSSRRESRESSVARRRKEQIKRLQQGLQPQGASTGGGGGAAANGSDVSSNTATSTPSSKGEGDAGRPSSHRASRPHQRSHRKHHHTSAGDMGPLGEPAPTSSRAHATKLTLPHGPVHARSRSCTIETGGYAPQQVQQVQQQSTVPTTTLAVAAVSHHQAPLVMATATVDKTPPGSPRAPATPSPATPAELQSVALAPYMTPSNILNDDTPQFHEAYKQWFREEIARERLARQALPSNHSPSRSLFSTPRLRATRSNAGGGVPGPDEMMYPSDLEVLSPAFDGGILDATPMTPGGSGTGYRTPGGGVTLFSLLKIGNSRANSGANTPIGRGSDSGPPSTRGSPIPMSGAHWRLNMAETQSPSRGASNRHTPIHLPAAASIEVHAAT